MSAASVCGQDAEEIVEERGIEQVPALDSEIAAASGVSSEPVSFTFIRSFDRNHQLSRPILR